MGTRLARRMSGGIPFQRQSNKGGAMDKPEQSQEQPYGNFVLNLNFRRNTNKAAPAITGRVSTPEDKDAEYSFSAFRHDGDKGAYWIGPVDMNRSLRQALHNPIGPRHQFRRNP
jgi:hypothetical protein